MLLSYHKRIHNSIKFCFIWVRLSDYRWSAAEIFQTSPADWRLRYLLWLSWHSGGCLSCCQHGTLLWAGPGNQLCKGWRGGPFGCCHRGVWKVRRETLLNTEDWGLIINGIWVGWTIRWIISGCPLLSGLSITETFGSPWIKLYLLPFSHDEVVHGKATIIQKMWGDYLCKFPQCRAVFAYMYTHPGKKLNFMGNEIGWFREWNEKRQQDWELLTYPLHDAFQRYIQALNLQRHFTAGNMIRAIFSGLNAMRQKNRCTFFNVVLDKGRLLPLSLLLARGYFRFYD